LSCFECIIHALERFCFYLVWRGKTLLSSMNGNRKVFVLEMTNKDLVRSHHVICVCCIFSKSHV